MKIKKIISLFLLVPAFITCFIFESTASITGGSVKYYTPQASSVRGYAQFNYSYGQVCLEEDLSKRSVSMTQDNNYYYFTISQYGEKSWSGSNGPEFYTKYYSQPFNSPFVVIAPFSNIYNMSYYNWGGNSTYKTQMSLSCSGIGTIMSSVENTSMTVNQNIMFGGFYSYGLLGDNTKYKTAPSGYSGINLIKDGSERTLTTQCGYKLLSNGINVNYSSTSSGRVTTDLISKLYGTIKYQVCVPKDQIEELRYCMPLSGENPSFYSSYGSSGRSGNAWSASFDHAVDLLEYSKCDHVWVREGDVDKTSHKIYCDKCKWHRSEPHNFEFEYDGLENDLCICGYTQKVKYNFLINDDVHDEEERIFDSFSEYEKIEYSHKTGYNFIKYKKYENRIKDISNLENEIETEIVDLGDCLNMTDITSNFSTTYKAIYNPINYYFNFSTINNLGFPLDSSLMPKQKFTYDESLQILSNWHIFGYRLEGWYSDNTFTTKLFDDKEEILNYFSIDNSEITLYPKFEKLKYSIVFQYNQLGTTKEINYLDMHYGDTRELPTLKVLPIDSQIRGWVYNNEVIHNTLDLDKYITSDNLVFVVKFEATTPDGEIANAYENDFDLKFKIIYNGARGTKHGDNPQIVSINDDNAKFTSWSSSERDYQIKGWSLTNYGKNITMNELKKLIVKDGQVVNLYALWYVNENYNSVSEEGTGPGEHYNGEETFFKEIPENENAELDPVETKEAFNPIKIFVNLFTDENEKAIESEDQIEEPEEVVEIIEEEVKPSNIIEKNGYRYSIKNLTPFEKIKIILGLN